jgi:hypothetical protein
MGGIGTERREIELEPVPDAPAPEPVVQPASDPAEEPVPA